MTDQRIEDIERDHASEMAALRHAFMALALHLRVAGSVDLTAVARTMMDFAQMNSDLGPRGKQVLQTMSFSVSEIEDTFHQKKPN